MTVHLKNTLKIFVIRILSLHFLRYHNYVTDYKLYVFYNNFDDFKNIYYEVRSLVKAPSMLTQRHYESTLRDIKLEASS